MKKKLRIVLVILLSLLVTGEIVLRILGFCKAPLFIYSNKYEYIAAPSQEGKRFGRHYHFNSFSQRSEEPDPLKVKILGLGDSVLFGGMQTDQDELATSIYTKTTGIQMLNTSAESWGPDNMAAYLNEKGLFGAKGIFLVVSSHDAHDNMTFVPTVGVHPSYPNEQFSLAWCELLYRYIIPVFKKTRNIEPGKTFNPGFAHIRQIAVDAQIPLIIYLHADKYETERETYRKYGREIIVWAQANKIPLIKELDYNFTKDDYRDEIHINASGQRKLADIMIKEIKF